jgi:ATP-dependent helicase IRC3
VSYRTCSFRTVELINSTIGTYQTLNNVERLKKFDPSKFKLVIVDEAHHAAAFS